MPGCVLDASAALALLAPSQTTPAARIFAGSLPEGMTAPCVFGTEVRHGVLRLERRGLLLQGSVDLELAALEQGMELAPPPGPAGLVRAMTVARQEALGMYDALYLDLALERGAALASRDGSLLAAAERRSVLTVDLR